VSASEADILGVLMLKIMVGKLPGGLRLLSVDFVSNAQRLMVAPIRGLELPAAQPGGFSILMPTGPR